MIDHFGINCVDLPAAARFYDTVLGVLGHRRVMDFGVAIGYGTDSPDFWISTFEGIGPNREVHIAFTAPDAATVRAF
ncbi:MAG: VOC family protein, partial [Candidatus Phosphoribacter baldrii]